MGVAFGGHVPTSTGVTGIKVRFCGRFVGRIYECSSRLDAWNRLNLVKEGRGDRFTAESLRLVFCFLNPGQKGKVGFV